MTTAALISAARADGIELMLTPAGVIKLRGDPAAVARWREVIAANKPAVLAELAANDPILNSAIEARRQRVLALLERHAEWRYAVIVETGADPGVVVVHIGIRGLATGEIVIDKARYDPVILMGCMDRAAERTQ